MRKVLMTTVSAEERTSTGFAYSFTFQCGLPYHIPKEDCPLNVDEKVIARLNELVAQGAQVLATRRDSGLAADDRVDSQLAAQWVTSVQSLLSRTFGVETAHYANFCKHVSGNLTYSPMFRAQGVLKAAVEDYVGGHLFQVRALIEAEVFDDFLEQANHLLQAGYFQPAGVICGCVLEDSLRKLCTKSGIDVSDKPKLDQMNSDLARVGAYNKLIQKRITALADLRNKAAHGQWDQFTRQDVEDMLRDVRRFVEEHA